LYAEVTEILTRSYDEGAARSREALGKEPWKVEQRAAFLQAVRAEGARTLLEVGAGTGIDSAFFAEEGLAVTATDLSPAMVEMCRAKGLDAHVRDVLGLDFPVASFDAAYSLNCLLHVPNSDLLEALATIARLLKPGGLFFLGLWGDVDSEGQSADDNHVPPRFFSFRSPETLLNAVAERFEVERHTMIEVAAGRTFQALVLRRR